MKSPYDQRTDKTRDRIRGNRRSYYPNKHYRSAEVNFYYYINTKGYYHVLRPCKVSYGGKFSHYEINDYLLKVDDTLKLVKNYGCYETREDVISELEKNLAKDN